MDHTSKWVLVPSNGEQNFLKEDFILSLAMFSKKLINSDGKLLSRDNITYLNDSSIFECFTKKNHAKHFSRFLELKTQLSEKKPLKRKKSNWSLDDE